MKTYLQIIINHASEQTPTIILHSGSQKYVFNCSENFMRFQKFNQIKCIQGMCFFITRLSSETLDGMLPNMTNLFGNGLAINDKVYGPSKTVQMFQAMKNKFYIKSLPYSFFGFAENKTENTPKASNYLLGVNDMDAIFGLQNDIEFPFNYFESNEIANNFIANKFKSEGETKKNFFNDARQFINTSGNYQDSEVEIVPVYVSRKEEEVLSYLIKFPKPTGKINKDKLKELKIPGQKMKEFQQNGQLEVDGRLIKLEEILEDAQPQLSLLIFDCVSEECVNNIIKNNEIQYKNSHDFQIFAVIHLTPIHILKSKIYEQFLKQFDENCNHIFVNSHLKNSVIAEKNKKVLRETFFHIEATNIIAEQFPENFPMISDDSSTYKSSVEFVQEEINDLFPYLLKKQISKKNYQLIFNPKKNEECYQPINQQAPSKRILYLNEFEADAKKTKEDLVNVVNTPEFIALDQIIKHRTKDYDPHVYFLGTTCMMPTTFRNNSSILIYEKVLKQAIMLDCGEGTYYQLLNQFGEAECLEVLKNLKCIILTHAHSDHYMGFQSIVYQRQKAFEIAKQQNQAVTEEQQTLYIALPWCLAPWYAAVDNFTERLNCKLIYFQEFNGENIQSLFDEYKKDEFDDKELEEQSKQEESKQNGDTSEDDGIVKPQKQSSKEVNEEQEEHKCDSNQQEEEGEEEEDNRGHKAKTRAIQLINYLKSTQQEIDESIVDFKQFILEQLGIEDIQFVPVIHCSQAYGVIFKHKSGIKISYSGDTRPCPQFAQLAQDSDLMIHEGTFNDDLLDHAKKARHSTASEAIDIGYQAKVKALVLTHLSKRHSKLDLGDFSDLTKERNRFIRYQTSLALDHLQFKLSEYFTVPFKSKCVHSIFPDDEK